MSSDAELLASWRAGDRRAGEALFARHFDAIARFFRNRLGDDVQDLVQRTFLDCVEGESRLGDGASVRGYLFGIARHRLVDHVRRHRARDFDPAVTSIADLATSPSAAVGRRDDQRLLQLALTQLPVDLQITLELAYWEGLAGPEIAQVLGIGANTVRGRLARAREVLRSSLAALEADPAAVQRLEQQVEVRSREFDQVDSGHG